MVTWPAKTGSSYATALDCDWWIPGRDQWHAPRVLSLATARYL